MKRNEETVKLAVPVNRQDHILGPSTAPLTLVEYGDYQCVYCGDAYPVIKEVRQILGDKLRFVFRNFPLVEAHPFAEHAAEAAESAAARKRFWEMHDILFEHQDALEDEQLAQYAMDLGLDATALISEVEQGRFAPRIQEDFNGGVESGVNGTPTFFINDIRYEGEDTLRSLLAALEEAESEKSSQRSATSGNSRRR
jgi:protein-disulfide isomerase